MTTMNNLVFKGHNNQVLTNSLLVAEKFGKNHKDVIEVITSILVKAENSAQTDNQQLAKMFALVEYDVPLNNGTGAVRKAPMYVMNRDGFTLLAMGFTGTILVTTTTKVTGKGQIYFINKFLREKQQRQAV